MKYIKIFDTTLRDGEQSPGIILSKKEKLKIAKQLKKLGVDIIEAGFPISSQEDYEAVMQIAKEIRGPIICGLARTVKEDIDRCWEAIKYSEKPRIHTFIATSKIHMDEKLKKSREEIIEIVREMVSYAHSLCVDIEFSLEDASRTENDFMYEVIRIAIESGATTINIPDTVGYSQPEEFGKKIKSIFDNLGDIILKQGVTISCHCHDDLGNAVANSLEAIKAGVTQVECTINGIGERAGNASLEEITMNIKTRKEYFNSYTGINAVKIYETSQMVSKMTNLIIQPNKAIVGKNAFSHESGIHQDGIIKNCITYEIMNPKDVGWIGENLIIGKHSGKRAVSKILSGEGYNFSEDEIVKITNIFKNLKNKNKNIPKEELIKIAKNFKNMCFLF